MKENELAYAHMSQMREADKREEDQKAHAKVRDKPQTRTETIQTNDHVVDP
ncbi:MAG: hypothetical protein PXY39_03430 [archaeon]|nr:hypothetical protein [archaeon]